MSYFFLVIQATIYGIAFKAKQKKSCSSVLKKAPEVYIPWMEWHITQALDTLYKCCAHTSTTHCALKHQQSLLKNTVK